MIIFRKNHIKLYLVCLKFRCLFALFFLDLSLHFDSFTFMFIETTTIVGVFEFKKDLYIFKF